MRSIQIFKLGSLLLLSAQIAVSGQVSCGELYGTVFIKESSAPLPAAHVFLKIFRSDEIVADVFCDQQGHYSLAGISPGMYSVVIAFPGFQSIAVDSIAISSNEKVNQDFCLITSYLGKEHLGMYPYPWSTEAMPVDSKDKERDVQNRWKTILHGTVLNPVTRSAIEGITITLLNSENVGFMSATSDVHGRYSLDNIPEGFYTMIVLNQDGEAMIYGNVQIESYWITVQDILIRR